MCGIQGVVYYFADAPFTAGGYGTTFGLENVQMLKGPQGTLFGIASNGGAVFYAPRRPTVNADAYAEVTGGNYNRFTIEGARNFQLLDDVCSFALRPRSMIATDGFTIFRTAATTKINTTGSVASPRSLA